MSKRAAAYELKPLRDSAKNDPFEEDSDVRQRDEAVKQKQNPFATVNIVTGDRNDDREMELKKHGLNNSLLVYLNEQFAKNPCVDFSGAFERYKSHLSSIVAKSSITAPMQISPQKPASTMPEFKPVGIPTEETLFPSQVVPVEKPKFTFEKPTSKPSELSFVAPIEQTPFAFAKPAEQVATQLSDVEKAKVPFSFASPSPVAPEKKPDVIFRFPEGQANIDKGEGVTLTKSANGSTTTLAPTFTFGQAENVGQQQTMAHVETPTKKPEFAFSFGQGAASIDVPVSKSPFQPAAGSPFSAISVTQSSVMMPKPEEDDEEADIAMEESSLELPSEEALKVLEEKPCKLHIFKDNEYLDRGVCIFRLAELSNGKKYVVVRVRGTGNLVINSPWTDVCRVKPVEGRPSLFLLCFDLNGKFSRFLLKFKSVEEALEIQKSIRNLL